MIKLIDCLELNGKEVEVIDVDNQIFKGVATIGTDFDTDRNYVDIEQPGKSYVVEIFEDEIKSIKAT